MAATHALKKLASKKGFIVHEVPGDGNCLFSYIAHQLESVNASEMREIVANHLDNNSVFYRNFLPQPVASDNTYNVDTEALSNENAFIDTINDSDQQM